MARDKARCEISSSTGTSRRHFLRQLAGMAGGSLFAGIEVPALRAAPQPPSAPSAGGSGIALTAEDDSLLEELERANFLCFLEQANPDTGLVRDRANVRNPNNNDVVASIAATGFGLTALSIGQQRGYIPLPEARDRALAALRFISRKLPNHRGFFYHFANLNTGERTWDSEVSSVDTAMLLCGVLTVPAALPPRRDQPPGRAHLQSRRLDVVVGGHLAAAARLDARDRLPALSLGLLQRADDDVSAGPGIGARIRCAWRPGTPGSGLTFEYDGLRYIGSFAPLFVHQYSQAWFDFRGKRDHYADYFRNSAIATDVHRRFCLELDPQFPDYSEDLWGITASDSAKGYVVWGGPPAMGPIDGTVVPSAAGGSLPFLPQPTCACCAPSGRATDRAWSRYGFVNAFNPLTNWYDNDVVGIDTGITMLMAENLRTRLRLGDIHEEPGGAARNAARRDLQGLRDIRS